MQKGTCARMNLVKIGLLGSWKGNGGVQPKPIQFPLRCGQRSIGDMLTMQCPLVKAKLTHGLIAG